MNEITNTEAFQQQQKDYSRVASALQFLVDQQASQPTLDDVANHVHLSSAHFQRLFKQWVGVSPREWRHNNARLLRHYGHAYVCATYPEHLPAAYSVPSANQGADTSTIR